MNVLVIGGGMYVAGRGTSDYGTVLPALAQASKQGLVERVTVAVRSRENAAQIAEAIIAIDRRLESRLRIETTNTLEAAFAPDASYDCAIVCLPDHAHHEWASRVLSRGVHCLVVKPFTPTLGEARALVALQESQALVGEVELHKRFDEANLVVRRAIREGRLGRIAYVSVAYSQRRQIPLRVFRSWTSRTNIFQYLAVHYVDLIYFLTGYLPRRALAVGTRGILSDQGVDTYDSVHALLEYRRPDDTHGFVATFDASWIDPDNSTAMSDQRFTIVAEHGRVDCDQKHRGVELVTQDDGARSVNPYFSEYLAEDDGLRFAGYGATSILRFLEDVRSVRAGERAWRELPSGRATFRDALPSTAAVEAVNASLAAGGSWRDVDDCT
ncbi:MAG TPA: Gfo/Idh/MocA family oxidoreductase [Polyangiales bacterium]|nr:Gfo/Idh/MocA family oxidoreductase [Polyangiales bacterium]